MASSIARVILLALVLAGLTACRAESPPRESPPRESPQSRTLRWGQVPLPVAAHHLGLGAGDPVLVSGQTTGNAAAQPGTDQSPAPALWSMSTSGRLTEVPLHPVSFYGERAELVRVAARGAHVVALGRAIGGAHGNPRFTTWSGTTSGLAEAVQPFEVFGGPDAIGVSDLAAGAGGDVIVGAWAHSEWPAGGSPAGIATWTRSGMAWNRLDREPGLRSTTRILTTGTTIAADGARFVIGGSVTRLEGGQISTRAEAFTQQAGGGWRALPLPARGESQAVDVACSRGVCLVAGVERGRVALWQVVPGPQGVGEKANRLTMPREVAVGAGSASALVAAAGADFWVLASSTDRPGSLWRVRGTDVQEFTGPRSPCTALAATDGPPLTVFAVCADTLVVAHE